MTTTKSKTIYFITGASGVGKTTLITQLKEKYANQAWGFLHFDSIGVTSAEEMTKNFGSPSGWQEAKTYEWIDKLVNEYEEERIIFEGQVNLQFIVDGFKKNNFENYKIVLVDCPEEEMAYRLTYKRNQPELLNEDMRNWLKFLRNQAKEFNAPIIETGKSSEDETLKSFETIANL